MFHLIKKELNFKVANTEMYPRMPGNESWIPGTLGTSDLKGKGKVHPRIDHEGPEGE
jgi:hypothetical protein